MTAIQQVGGSSLTARIRPPPRDTLMGAAIGLAAMIVVFAVFLPRVLSALEEFLLTFFRTATEILQAFQVPQ